MLPSNRKLVEKHIIVSNDDRRTSDTLNKFEYSAILSERTEYISEDSTTFINIDGMDDPREIAKAEIRQRKCPIMIKRYVGTKDGQKYFEIVSPNDLIHPPNLYE